MPPLSVLPAYSRRSQALQFRQVKIQVYKLRMLFIKGYKLRMLFIKGKHLKTSRSIKRSENSPFHAINLRQLTSGVCILFFMHVQIPVSMLVIDTEHMEVELFLPFSWLHCVLSLGLYSQHRAVECSAVMEMSRICTVQCGTHQSHVALPH